MFYWYKLTKEKSRHIKLENKLQKRGLIHLKPLIIRDLHSWNKRFNFVSAVESIKPPKKYPKQKPKYKNIRTQPLKKVDWQALIYDNEGLENANI